MGTTSKSRMARRKRKGSVEESASGTTGSPKNTCSEPGTEALEGEGSFDPGVLDQSSNEVKFGRNLAHSTDKSVRDRTVQALRIWLRRRSGKLQLPYLEQLKIWRGLWFCMWMCDKSEVQEELAESMADLIHLYAGRPQEGISFLRAFLETMRGQWGKLDSHRLDKFYRLIRKIMRESMLYSLREGAGVPFSFMATLYSEILGKLPNGPRLHIADIFVPELCSASSESSLHTAEFLIFFEPWCDLLARGGFSGQGPSSRALCQRVMDVVFEALLGYGFAGEEEPEPGDDSSEDGKGWNGVFEGVELRALQSRLHFAASDPNTSEAFRSGIWGLVKKLQKKTGAPKAGGVKESVWRASQQNWCMRDQGEEYAFGWAAAAGVTSSEFSAETSTPKTSPKNKRNAKKQQEETAEETEETPKKKRAKTTPTKAKPVKGLSQFGDGIRDEEMLPLSASVSASKKSKFESHSSVDSSPKNKKRAQETPVESAGGESPLPKNSAKKKAASSSRRPSTRGTQVVEEAKEEQMTPSKSKKASKGGSKAQKGERCAPATTPSRAEKKGSGKLGVASGGDSEVNPVTPVHGESSSVKEVAKTTGMAERRKRVSFGGTHKKDYHASKNDLKLSTPQKDAIPTKGLLKKSESVDITPRSTRSIAANTRANAKSQIQTRSAVVSRTRKRASDFF